MYQISIYKYWCNYTMIHYMDVSKNRDTPKWMVKIMENPIKMDDLGDPPLFLETSIYKNTVDMFNPKGQSESCATGRETTASTGMMRQGWIISCQIHWFMRKQTIEIFVGIVLQTNVTRPLSYCTMFVGAQTWNQNITQSMRLFFLHAKK